MSGPMESEKKPYHVTVRLMKNLTNHSKTRHEEKLTCDFTADEIARFYDTLAADKLAGIKRRCLAAEACLYTVTADEHFVIDRHPETDLVMVASPCSGHGFKHSAAIGEALVEMALEGTSRLSTAPFAFSRLHVRGLV